MIWACVKVRYCNPLQEFHGFQLLVGQFWGFSQWWPILRYNPSSLVVPSKLRVDIGLSSVIILCHHFAYPIYLYIYQSLILTQPSPSSPPFHPKSRDSRSRGARSLSAECWVSDFSKMEQVMRFASRAAEEMFGWTTLESWLPIKAS